MRLGIDFDNTIVCYDALFHRVAREGGWIPEDLPANKSEVRNHLRRIGREDVWTEMQGLVYGQRLLEAEPYPGVREFFRACRAAAIPVCIISHKTRQPFRGPPYDLHAAALGWLDAHGFFDPNGIALSRDNVFFELTKDEKLRRIAACQCTHFIDDLPEFLGESRFPEGVERFLFDPGSLYAGETRFHRVRHWNELARELLRREPVSARPGAEDIEDASRAFLNECGVRTEGVSWERLSGGANNRVWRIRVPGGAAFVLKEYFQHSADPRDRFRAERSFYDWARRCAPGWVLETLGWDGVRRWGLFCWVSGRRLVASDITDDVLDQTAMFAAILNRDRTTAAGLGMPAASEACFSIEEHLACVDRRVIRLSQLPAGREGTLEAAVQRWVGEELVPAWKKVREHAVRDTSVGPLEVVLPIEARCVSPSDFGFHNALLADDGRLRFFDFEYAGWDDPAKLVCDFFCQPEVPVPLRYWDFWIASLDQALRWEGHLAHRSRILLPAYRVKWACIVLNEFVRTDQARREFAKGPGEVVARREAQFIKARRMLASLGDAPFA